MHREAVKKVTPVVARPLRGGGAQRKKLFFVFNREKKSAKSVFSYFKRKKSSDGHSAGGLNGTTKSGGAFSAASLTLPGR